MLADNQGEVYAVVLPVGHWMFSSTRVSLMVPSIAAVSILGWLPQSAQYIFLKNEEGTLHLSLLLALLNLSLHSCSCFPPPFHRPPLVSHSPSLGVNYNGVWLINHAGNQGFAVVSTTYLGHLDDISTGVSPVQVPCHPVHSDAPRHLQIWNLNRKEN